MNQRITFVAVMAWLTAAVYYFFQYALRSAPSVMIPQLTDAFSVNLGIPVGTGFMPSTCICCPQAPNDVLCWWAGLHK